MTRNEVDFDAKLWTIPAARMKAMRPHRVPLSDRAVELLQALQPLEGNPYTFPGTRPPAPVSDMTLLAVIKRMNEVGSTPRWVDPKTPVEDGNQVVPHGFRSVFRDWAAETTDYPAEMAEMALAHVVGDKVEAAYRRGDMFQKRRQMMDDWAVYLGSASDVP